MRCPLVAGGFLWREHWTYVRGCLWDLWQGSFFRGEHSTFAMLFGDFSRDLWHSAERGDAGNGCMARPTAGPQAWVSPVEVISAAFLLYRICTGVSFMTLGLMCEKRRALMHDKFQCLPVVGVERTSRINRFCAARLLSATGSKEPQGELRGRVVSP